MICTLHSCESHHSKRSPGQLDEHLWRRRHASSSSISSFASPPPPWPSSRMVIVIHQHIPVRGVGKELRIPFSMDSTSSSWTIVYVCFVFIMLLYAHSATSEKYVLSLCSLSFHQRKKKNYNSLGASCHKSLRLVSWFEERNSVELRGPSKAGCSWNCGDGFYIWTKLPSATKLFVTQRRSEIVTD